MAEKTQRNTPATAPKQALNRFVLTHKGDGSPYTARATFPLLLTYRGEESRDRYGIDLDDIMQMKREGVKLVDLEVGSRKLTLDLQAVAEGNAGFCVTEKHRVGKKIIEYLIATWKENIGEEFSVE